jgi:hypothetical protein
MVKVIGPPSGVSQVSPPSTGVERQRQEVRAESHRLDFIVRKKTVNAQPHRLLLFLNMMVPPGLSEFQERFEVGLVSQATPVILIDESPVVGSDLHMPRSGALRITKLYSPSSFVFQ